MEIQEEEPKDGTWEVPMTLLLGQSYMLGADTVDDWRSGWELRSELRGSTSGLASHTATKQDNHQFTGATTEAGKSKAIYVTEWPRNPKGRFKGGRTGNPAENCLASVSVPNRLSLWLWWLLPFSLALGGMQGIWMHLLHPWLPQDPAGTQSKWMRIGIKAPGGNLSN
jgi:hypothetical protein